MKKFLMALVVLAIASGPVLAGPNEYGVLVVHNTGIRWTSDLPSWVTPVPACAEVVNEAALGAGPADALIWKVYAAFPLTSSPRLVGLGFGIMESAVGGGGITILHNEKAPGAFAITTALWPDAGEVGMSFPDSVRTTHVTELWYFDGYAYAGGAGEPQLWSTVMHSGPSNRLFVDDAFPQNTDLIAGYGTLGFGQAGYTPCPVVPQPAACCFPLTGACSMLLPADCVAAGGDFYGGECLPTNPCPPVPVYGACCDPFGQCSIVTATACANIGGTYYGDGSTCTPGLCPPVPTESKSWGQIKSSYR